MGNQVCAHTGKIGAGFLNILFGNGYGDILFLYNAVRSRGFVKQHLIVFLAVHITGIAAHRH